MKANTTIASRSIDDLGRTVICRPIRNEYGYEFGNFFKFSRVGNGILATKLETQEEIEAESDLRCMDDLGRLTLPERMRRELDMREGDEVAQINHEDGILLVLNRAGCGLCGTISDDMVDIGHKRKVCRTCLTTARKQIRIIFLDNIIGHWMPKSKKTTAPKE